MGTLSACSDSREAALPAPVAEPEPAVSIRGLTKTYGGKHAAGEPALSDVDLDVHAGEFLVLLGPSGCGKTTLLRSIAGLEHPDAGVIHIEGRPAFDADAGIDVSPGRRPLSMIFQSYALWPHMTARRNVAFPLRCAGVRRTEIGPRVDEILEKVGIGHLADRHPGEMSGGQQQRLALARALVVGERLVLFDEPLSNVDAQVRENLRVELIRMQKSLGFTAIYVTHDQSEAFGLADRIAVMSIGRIDQVDEPRELYERPHDVRVARFLGQSNEVPFVVESYDAASNRIDGEGQVGKVSAAWLRQEDDAAEPRPGERFIAFGRLTDFRFQQHDGDAGALNRWAGVVETVRFLGAHVEYVVRVGNTRFRCWLGERSDTHTHGALDGVVSVDSGDLRAMREV